MTNPQRADLPTEGDRVLANLILKHRMLSKSIRSHDQQKYREISVPDDYARWLAQLAPDRRRIYEQELEEDFEATFGDEGLMSCLAKHRALSDSTSFEDRYPAFVDLQEYNDWIENLHPDELKVYKWQLAQDYENFCSARSEYRQRYGKNRQGGSGSRGTEGHGI